MQKGLCSTYQPEVLILDYYLRMYQFGTDVDDVQVWLELRGETNGGLDGALGILGDVSTTRWDPTAWPSKRPSFLREIVERVVQQDPGG